MLSFGNAQKWLLASAILAATVSSLNAADVPADNDHASMERELQKYLEDPKQNKELVGMVQWVLATFGYGVGPFDGTMDTKTRNAIEQYQKKRGLKPSAGLDALTFKALFEDFDVFTADIPYLPSFILGEQLWDSGYVTAEGTWTLEQDEMGFPIQTTKIRCYRKSKECVTATAELGGMKNDYLSVDMETYEIERWDKHEIVTAPKEYYCARYTLRLLKAQKAVTASRVKINDSEQCKDIVPELRLRLEDGVSVYHSLGVRKAERLKKFMLLPWFIGDQKGSSQ